MFSNVMIFIWINKLYIILFCLKKIWISRKILRKKLYSISAIFLISQQTQENYQNSTTCNNIIIQYNIFKKHITFFLRYDKNKYIYIYK